MVARARDVEDLQREVRERREQPREVVADVCRGVQVLLVDEPARAVGLPQRDRRVKIVGVERLEVLPGDIGRVRHQTA